MIEFLSTFFTEVWHGIQETSLIEGIAVLSGIFYLIGISYRKIWGWYFAVISTSVYVYICYANKIYIESGLQLFYVFMAFYGFLNWKKTKEKEIKIIVWPWRYHILNIIISSIVAIALAQMFIAFTDQQSPYLDAFSTTFSLLATFMVAKKVLENWIYWIVIDIILTFLYASRGLYLTSVHYLIFSVIAIFAFFKWFGKYKSQKTMLK